MRSRILIALITMFFANAAFALSIGEKEVKMFKNEVLKCAKDVFSHEGEEIGNAYVIKIKDRPIRDIMISTAIIKCYGYTGLKFREYASGFFSYEDLKENISLAVKCSISEKSAQDYINIAINRVSKNRRIFDEVVIKLLDEKARIRGKLNLKNLNLPAFMNSKEEFYFEAEVGIKIHGSQIFLEIYKAEFDGSSYPMLLSALLSWLNPVWDFSALPDKASIDFFEIKSGTINAFGRLFR